MNIGAKKTGNLLPINSATWIGILTFAILIGFVALVLSSHGWNPQAFILKTPEDLPDGQTWGVGYDGRFAYAISAHPWGSVEDLDQPGFRYQRIVYPLLVKLLSFGNIGFIPWVMIGVNIIASLIVSASLATLISYRRLSSSWLSLVFILSIGFLLSIRMDLNEPLAYAFGLSGWVAYEKKRSYLAYILFALSGLTKEVGLLFPAAFALWEFIRKRYRHGLALIFSGILPYLLWYLALFVIFGTSSEQIEKSRLSLFPLSGLRFIEDPVSIIILFLWVILPALLAGLLAIIDFIRISPAAENDKALFFLLSQVALISVLPTPTWEDPLAILRFGMGLIAAILIWLPGRHPKLLPFFAGLWLPSGALLFVVPGMVF